MLKFDTDMGHPLFNDLHHALGQPWPEEIMKGTRRNSFAVDSGSKDDIRMASSEHWTLVARHSDKPSYPDDLVFYAVSERGKAALVDHIKNCVEVPNRYTLRFHDHPGKAIVAARSRSAARYAYFIEADDGRSFIDFAKLIASIRIHARGSTPHQKQ